MLLSRMIGGGKVNYSKNTTSEALVLGGEIGVPLYILGRLLLFIYPPLSLWYALPVGVVGLVGLWRSSFEKSPVRYGGALAWLMLGGAMTFQTLEMYEVMNVCLFSMLITVVGSGLVVAVQGLVANLWDESRLNSWGRRIFTLSKYAFFPSLLFVAEWMFSQSLIVSFNQVDLVVAGIFSGVLVSMVIGVGWRVSAAAKAINFEVNSGLNSPLMVKGSGDYSLIGLAIVVILVAFFVPNGLVAIGADPLVENIGTWMVGVLSGGAALRLLVLGGVSGVIMVVVYLFRANGGAPFVLAIDDLEQAKEDSVCSSGMVRSFGRESLRLIKKFTITPISQYGERWHGWWENHVQWSVYFSMGLMVTTVVISLMIAL